MRSGSVALGVQRWHDTQLGIDGLIAAGEGPATGTHMHRSWQIGLVLDGRVVVSAGGDVFELSAGRGMWIAPDEPHAVEGTTHAVYIQVEVPASALAPSPLGPSSGWSSAAMDVALEALVSARACDTDRRRRELDALLVALTAQLASSSPLSRDPIAEQVRLVLDQHPGKHIRIDELASLLRVPSTTLRRRFKARYSVGIAAFQLGRRLQHGLALVEAGTDVGVAATAAGFADQAHFTRCARRVLGMPPRQWSRRPRT